MILKYIDAIMYADEVIDYYFLSLKENNNRTTFATMML
jgi:hypothetical protein